MQPSKLYQTQKSISMGGDCGDKPKTTLRRFPTELQRSDHPLAKSKVANYFTVSEEIKPLFAHHYCRTDISSTHSINYLPRTSPILLEDEVFTNCSNLLGVESNAKQKSCI